MGALPRACALLLVWALTVGATELFGQGYDGDYSFDLRSNRFSLEVDDLELKPLASFSTSGSGLTDQSRMQGRIFGDSDRHEDQICRPSGILVCSRKTRARWMPGNHAYLWDMTKGEGYGRSFNGTAEAGPLFDQCNRVLGSEGKEAEIMRSIKRDDRGFYFPFLRDCHDSTRKAIKDAGLSYPGAPGGRLGPPRNKRKPRSISIDPNRTHFDFERTFGKGPNP